MSGYEIYRTELWPVLYISSTKSKNAIQIPDDKVLWLEQVEAEFAKAQDYLAELAEGEQK